ncbi:hypothetical protein ABGB07_34325 [Micromonosporaceae bacterium B7E4]
MAEFGACSFGAGWFRTRLAGRRRLRGGSHELAALEWQATTVGFPPAPLTAGSP